MIPLVAILLAVALSGCAPAMSGGRIRAELEQRLVIVDDKLAAERNPWKQARLRLCQHAIAESYALMRAGHTARAERSLDVVRDLMGPLL